MYTHVDANHIKMNTKNIGLTPLLTAAFAVIALMLCSCASSKDNITYFQDVFALPDSAWNNQHTEIVRIHKNDELSIIVNAVEPTAAAAFNKVAISRQGANDTNLNTVPSIQTYIVNQRGEIEFPVLGTIQVQGKTALELQDELSERIKEYVKDPIVSVSILGFSITVLGEVAAPGISYLNGNRATLLDAIGRRGDLTIYGQRNNILLIRENEGKREIHKIDLTSADFICSPYYYVQQNDVIYVMPNDSKKDTSKYNNLKSYNIALVGTIVSCVSVLASLAIAIWK